MFAPNMSLNGLFEDAFINADSYPREYIIAMNKIKQLYKSLKKEIKNASSVEELNNIEDKMNEQCEALYEKLENEIDAYGGIKDANDYLEDALYEILDKQYEKIEGEI